MSATGICWTNSTNAQTLDDCIKDVNECYDHLELSDSLNSVYKQKLNWYASRDSIYAVEIDTLMMKLEELEKSDSFWTWKNLADKAVIAVLIWLGNQVVD